MKTARAKNAVATKAGAPAKPPTPKSRQLTMVAKSEAEKDRQAARMHLSHVPAALVAVDFARPTAGDLSLMETIAFLKDNGAAVNAGDLKDAEAMLMSQAIALNTVFSELARRAALNMGEYMDATDKYMRLAMKAQGQCRATLETLAAIKNAPVVFARQANITNGPQQVNNGVPIPPRAGNSEFMPNELLATPSKRIP